MGTFVEASRSVPQSFEEMCWYFLSDAYKLLQEMFFIQ